MGVEVVLIRHAESAMNLRPDLIGGQSNWAPLSAAGEGQAQRLGEYFVSKGEKPSKVVSSPAIRAKRTAELSLSAMGLDPELCLDPALLELDQGEWEGLDRATVYTPDVVAHIHSMNGSFRAPGGESPYDAARRMYAAVDRHTDGVEPEGGPVFLYGHGFTFRAYVGLLVMNWPYQQVIKSELQNTSITRLLYDGSTTELVSFNETPE
ncbi:histidine phosphatase family protein [Candidatus Saccharibacteria bacterium]|nr:histidine phosphatase family protein [Candidatus Saccharibacteria bacterium]